MHYGQAKKIVERAIDCNVAVMLWGPPGIGKSSLVKEIAKERGIDIKDIRLAQMDPVDIRGVLLPNNDKSSVDWLLPSLWPTEGRGIIFLDEIEKAPRSVKAAALQLVLDRCIGDYRLPEGWAIVCAGNPDDILSSQMGDALNNRMIHIQMESNSQQWIEWALSNNTIDPRIVGFISFRKDLLYKATGHEAFPSPRSWEMASKLISNLDDNDPNISAYISAAIGEGTAIEFGGWLSLFSKVDVDAILKSGIIPQFEETDLAFMYAITTTVGISFKEMDRNERDRVAPNLSLLFDKLPVEFILMFTKFLPDREVAVFGHPALRKHGNAILDAIDYSYE